MRALAILRWLTGLLALVAARLLTRRRCGACRALLAADTVFCRTCAVTVEWVDGDPPRAAARWGGAVRTTVLRLKYEGEVSVARPLAHVVLQRLESMDLPPIDLVVPVPLHPTKLAARGFNQCALVAAEIARVLGARHVPGALRRVRVTATQAELGRDARLENVRGAFGARAPAELRGRSVLLIDDVTTTGATMAAAAHALEAAGAAVVIPFAIAEQVQRSEQRAEQVHRAAQPATHLAISGT